MNYWIRQGTHVQLYNILSMNDLLKEKVKRLG
jgi:hypothetical protein